MRIAEAGQFVIHDPQPLQLLTEMDGFLFLLNLMSSTGQLFMHDMHVMLSHA